MNPLQDDVELRIFKSRIFLTYFDEIFENKFLKMRQKSLNSLKLKNCLFSSAFFIFGIVNIIYDSLNPILLPSNIKNVSYCCLGMSFINGLSTFLMHKKIKFIKNIRYHIGQVTIGVNLFVLNFEFLYLILKYKQDAWEIILFFIILNCFAKLIYIAFFTGSFSTIILSNIFILLSDFTLLTNYGPSTSPYFLITIFLAFFICSIFAFYDSYVNRVNNYILFQLENILFSKKNGNTYEKICNNLKVPLLKINKKGDINYTNKFMSSILGLKKNLNNQENQSSQKSQMENVNLNMFKFFIKNSISKNYFVLEDDEKIINCEDQNLLENIFFNLSEVNEDLATQNFKLYQFLVEFMSAKMNLKSKTNFGVKEFLNHTLKAERVKKKKSLKFSSNIMTNLINEESKFNSNYLPVNNTETNNQNEIVLTLNKNRSLLWSNYSNQELVYLGLSSMYKNNQKFEAEEKKEFKIYYMILSDIKEVCFILDEKNENTTNIMQQTSEICKSVYLSKFSHEIKNPISNLMEISTNLNQELVMSGLHSSIIKEFEHSCESSCSEEDENYVLKKETRRKIMHSSKLINSTLELLVQVLKDFSFYSSYTPEQKFISPTENYSEVRINRSSIGKNTCNPETIKNVNTLKKFSSNDVVQKYWPAETFQDFNFKEVLGNVFNIFVIKAKIENREKKIIFLTRFNEISEEFLDCDKETFQSLIFNVYHHIYRSLITGQIILFVSQNKLTKEVTFEFNVSGFMSQLAHSEIKLLKNLQDTSRAECDMPEAKRIEYSPEKVLFGALLKSRDLKEKNSLIDSFNNGFNMYISHLYCKNLNTKLIYEHNDEHTFKFTLPGSKNPIINNTKPRRNSSFNFLGFLTNKSVRSNLMTYQQKQKKEDPFKQQKTLVTSRRNTVSQLRSIMSYDMLSKDEININMIEQFTVEKSLTLTKRTNNSKQLSFNYVNYMNKDYCVREMFANYVDNSKDISQPSVKFVKLDTKFLSKTKVNFIGQDVPVVRKRLSMEISLGEKRSLQTIKDTIKTNTSKSKSRSQKKISISNLNSSSSFSSHSESKLGSILNNFNEAIKILICDDEKLIRKTVQRYFESMAADDPYLIFDIQHASDGFEALHTIYKYLKKGGHFDIIIIDETMPFLKGSQLINLLKTMIKDNGLDDIFIASYTSYDSPDKIEYLHSQGADCVLTKPMRCEEFCKTISEPILKCLRKKKEQLSVLLNIQ